MKRKTTILAVLTLVALVILSIPVSAASAKPSLSKSKMTLYVGSSYTLKTKGFSGKVTWKSSNKKIATVSKKGKVKAKKPGTVTITAKHGKQKKSCKVRVKQVKLSKTRITVAKGKTFKLKLYCGASKGIKWKTSKSSVVKIRSTSKNQVTLGAVKTGKATITATYKGKNYKCVVTVKKKTSGDPSKPDDPDKPQNGDVTLPEVPIN